MSEKVLIMGAAGRDFHNFLTFFRGQRRYEVVGFTAEQISGIANRSFPAELAGRRYPSGIPIHPESELRELIRKLDVDHVCLSYSDLSHQDVMVKASLVLSAGANFLLLGPKDTYVKADKPVISINAVRTGCGKSQTARAVAGILRKHGMRVAAIRHAMPYGDLRKQACQRFASAEDFEDAETTIEEEEEYQPWIDHGFAIYSGFDYREIVRRAQREADILVFDGGNNDFSMIESDLYVTVADPHRAGHELTYYPGFTNLLLADVVVINKVDSASKEDVRTVASHVRRYNPAARIVKARSEVRVDRPDEIRGRDCVVIGDGPTLSHGGAASGAGSIAVERCGGKIVDPRDWLVGSVRETFRKFPHLALEIPAMGYSRKQVRDVERTVNRVPCDVVVDGSPADLSRVMRFVAPVVQVGYELGKRSTRQLEELLEEREFFRVVAP